MATNTGTDMLQSFAATGVGTDVLTVRSARLGFPARATIWITGTFVGTVTLEGSAPGNNSFGTVSGASFTTPTSASLTFAADEDVRFNVTAYTSGTINCWIKIAG